MCQFKYIPLFLTVILSFSYNKVCACKGCVGLDEVSFEKVIPRFKVVLVKFDVAFPYGEKHETYGKFSEETARIKDLLFAEVGVKDYGEKDNEKLAKRYGVRKEDFPAIKLFKQGLEKPIDFPKDKEFTVNDLRTFVRDNTDIYIGLPGCLEKYDKLAKLFMDTDDKESILDKAEELTKDLPEQSSSSSAKTYVLIMKKILNSGKNFLLQETERVGKLLKGKISPKKQQELQYKLNIIRAFAIPRKDEL